MPCGIPHGLSLADGRVHGLLDGGAVVGAIVGRGAEVGDGHRAGRLCERRGDLLEVDEIDDVPGRRVLGVLLEGHGGAGRDRRQERVDLVVEVVGAGPRRVVRRVPRAAVEPGVAGGQREALDPGAVDVEAQGRVEATASRRVGDGVAHDDAVGLGGGGEAHVVAGGRQLHRAPPRGLLGDLALGARGAEDGGVGLAVLRLVLHPGHGGPDATDRASHGEQDLAGLALPGRRDPGGPRGHPEGAAGGGDGGHRGIGARPGRVGGHVLLAAVGVDRVGAQGAGHAGGDVGDRRPDVEAGQGRRGRGRAAVGAAVRGPGGAPVGAAGARGRAGGEEEQGRGETRHERRTGHGGVSERGGEYPTG